ncbi:hypothetical protein SynMEDNS5_01806 [Synechococcus sp. MEDNS5]|uniref:hypothetical protein n=1 Tax=Synechococcus sp. MEDNS5 TaxID=1442554 RepID=UPI001646DE26|nr:hypothetical protein [Synechococcus sp. MEDNS5]QNJ06521.1 hypothetical protein SynMEDNS5_01806 [Synechococcus sp. MEDNS5]
MKRISFKHLVFLALLVMSFSLVPSTIVHSAPESVLLGQSEKQAPQPQPSELNAGNKSGDAEARDGQEKLSTDAGLEAQDTIESLRDDLNQLQAELKTATETPAPFGIRLEIILASAALLASVVSILLFWRLFQSLDNDLRRIKASVKNFENQIALKFGGLETEQERRLAQMKADVQSVQKKQAFFEASSALKSQPSPFQAATSSSPPTTAMVSNIPENSPPKLTVGSLIQAINSGDRQALREATTAELNITSSSENSILMGMSQATELEEVSAGGSYLLVSLERRMLLFPTDRTLRSFSTTQPSNGLYSYVQQSIANAEIIEPAVLEKSGLVWRVIQKGRVAIP